MLSYLTVTVKKFLLTLIAALLLSAIVQIVMMTSGAHSAPFSVKGFSWAAAGFFLAGLRGLRQKPSAP